MAEQLLATLVLVQLFPLQFLPSKPVRNFFGTRSNSECPPCQEQPFHFVLRARCLLLLVHLLRDFFIIRLGIDL